MTKKKKPRTPSDRFNTEGRARALKALVTGDHITPQMRDRIANKLIADTVTASAKTEYIRNLVAAHPRETSAKVLFENAEKSVIGEMAFKTFENKVSGARKE
ncbi:MAG TPA: hypothetical protein VGL34_03180 [Steroidobacteraceae bacterium]